ncbi:uncharacterized protein C1orf198 homolog [Ctenodactylus gundi]
MASMAAAIAASRSAVMSGNRPLDERERKRFTYFSSLSPMARKIMQDKERIREKYGAEWARFPPAQQDEILDRCLVGPRSPSSAEPGDAGGFPGLRGPTGQKLVRFGDEDITWQDEHSAPFSWETRSQMEFSIASLSIQEPGTGTPPGESRPPPKAPPGSRSSSLDALGPARREEEASFWKIHAERSREAPEAEFQSLTPSQVKSMEKGEKALPTCCRPDSTPRDREAKAPRAEPPAGRPAPSQAPAHMAPEVAPTQPPGKLPSLEARQDQETEEDALFLEPRPAQVTSSSVVLKTGFDFLDNW